MKTTPGGSVFVRLLCIAVLASQLATPKPQAKGAVEKSEARLRSQQARASASQDTKYTAWRDYGGSADSTVAFCASYWPYVRPGNIAVYPSKQEAQGYYVFALPAKDTLQGGRRDEGGLNVDLLVNGLPDLPDLPVNVLPDLFDLPVNSHRR